MHLHSPRFTGYTNILIHMYLLRGAYVIYVVWSELSTRLPAYPPLANPLITHF